MSPPTRPAHVSIRSAKHSLTKFGTHLEVVQVGVLLDIRGVHFGQQREADAECVELLALQGDERLLVRELLGNGDRKGLCWKRLSNWVRGGCL